MTATRSACRLSAATAMMLSIAWHEPAASAPNGQETRPVIACVDARATSLLNDRQRVARHTARWRTNMERLGRCFTTRPGERWEHISSLGGLVLMRRTPPEPGLPPLYFPTAMAPGPVPEHDDQVSRDPVAPGAAITAKLAPKPLPGPVQTASQVPVVAKDEIRVEPLPPPEPAPVKVGPVAAAPVKAVPLDPAPPVQPAPAHPRISILPASSRGYAIGFVLAIVLITLLLAAMALLVRFLVRWSPDQTRPVSEPTLPPIISRIRPDLQRPPNLHRIEVPWAAPTATAPGMLQPAGLPPEAENWPDEDQSDIQRHFAALLLREAGWDANIHSRPGQPHADVVARRDGRIMVLRCLPDEVPVDEQAVEEACIAREREQADVAVILSSAAFTAGARRLAAQTGVDLLHEGELRDFVG